MQLAQHSATSPIPHPAISLPAPHIRLASFRRPTRATFQPPTLPPIVPVKPVSPAMPKWPVNEQPQPASVVWNGHELSVSATNSSLVQILNEISTATGLKVEGISADQRIFGTYGPAPARDILAQLMDGSDYSVMIVGDKGQGVPRELVLSAKISVSDLKRPNGAQTSNADDDSTDEPEPVEQPIEPTRRPLGGMPQPPQGPRTPQQMMQELQQRQQQMLAHPTPQ